MTEQERIIVSAYTGYLLCDFDKVHEYIEKKMGRPVWTHELASKEVWEEIRDRCREDFIALKEPEKRTEERAKTHARDLISRQEAIDALKDMYHAAEKWGEEASDEVIKARAESCMASLVEMKLRIEKLPSAQREIITCKECKYKDENCRRACTGWLPCMDAQTGGDWYCGSAKRGEQNG